MSWGLLARRNRGSVHNVRATGTVTGPSHSGLLVGTNEGVIEHGFSEGVISANGAHIGGLVGVNLGTIRRSGSTAHVTGDARVGGLVGRQSAPGVIDACYALGRVTGAQWVGGLVGTLFGGEIVNAYARSELVTAPEAGGLVGNLEPSPTTGTAAITNCYAAGMLDGVNAAGLVGRVDEGSSTYTVTSAYFHDSASGAIGTALSTEQMTMEASFMGWDFAAIWQFDGVISTYPSLRFQQPDP